MNHVTSASIAEITKSLNNCIITSHVNPDGDACGSSLALYKLITENKGTARIIYTSKIPTNMTWLPDSEVMEYYTPEDHDNDILNAEYLFCLDFNSPSRTMRMEEIILKRTKPTIVIDHHEEPQEFASYYRVDITSSSTCEMIWEIAHVCKEMYGFNLTKDFATACYTGIMTDTGGFRFPRTDAELHRIVANLIELGADPVSIYESVMNDGSFSRTLLLGRTLSHMELFCNGKLCIQTINKTWFAETGSSLDETEGFIQNTLTIKGVVMGILFIEHPTEDVIKISIRSKGDVEARALAIKFGGGGHFHAAAARFLLEKLEDVKRAVIESALTILNKE